MVSRCSNRFQRQTVSATIPTTYSTRIALFQYLLSIRHLNRDKLLRAGARHDLVGHEAMCHMRCRPGLRHHTLESQCLTSILQKTNNQNIRTSCMCRSPCFKANSNHEAHSAAILEAHVPVSLRPAHDESGYYGGNADYCATISRKTLACAPGHWSLRNSSNRLLSDCLTPIVYAVGAL
jgi:hypothetical protein